MNSFLTKALCLASVFSASTSLGWGSLTEARLHPEKVTFSSPGDQIEVVFSSLRGKELNIRVRIKDLVIDIPKNFMFDAKDILVESIRLRVPNPSPNPSASLWTQAVDDGFFIVFEFGGDYEHGTEENPVEVRKGLMIEFEKGRLVYAAVATPSGDFKNQWKIRDRDLRFLDPKDQEGELIENQVKCSFFRSDGQ